MLYRHSSYGATSAVQCCGSKLIVTARALAAAPTTTPRMPSHSSDEFTSIAILGLPQVHISYMSPTSVVVRYVTGTAEMGPAALASQPPTVPSTVMYGMRRNGPFKYANGTSTTYTQEYTMPHARDLPYRSPLIHHVPLTGTSAALESWGTRVMGGRRPGWALSMYGVQQSCSCTVKVSFILHRVVQEGATEEPATEIKSRSSCPL